MMKFSLVIVIAIIIGCSSPKKKNIIVFSCINCKGCVMRQLQFIEQEAIDQKIEIILDSVCLNQLIKKNKIKYTQMSSDQILDKYGEFGNLLYFNSKGKKTELLTDMELKDFIEK